MPGIFSTVALNTIGFENETRLMIEFGRITQRRIFCAKTPPRQTANHHQPHDERGYDGMEGSFRHANAVTICEGATWAISGRHPPFPTPPASRCGRCSG